MWRARYFPSLIALLVIVIIHNCSNNMQEHLIKHKLQSNIYKTMQFFFGGGGGTSHKSIAARQGLTFEFGQLFM